MLDPDSGRVEPIARSLSTDAPPSWLPQISVNGCFDEIAGRFVALYRDSTELWFQVGRERWLVSEYVTSSFAPDIPNTEPEPGNADRERTFRLFVDGAPRLELTYALHDREQRLRTDPFPAWPEEEEDYDLLYFVHRILIGERWRNVLANVPITA